MQPLYTDITPAGTTSIAGKQLLFFSGFSYLGLHAHPVFRELLKAGIDRYGTVFISSRIANIRLSLYEEMEQALARLLQQEAAATFSSGYLAAQAAIQYATTQGQLLYAPAVHPALRLNNPVIPALSWNNWVEEVVIQVNSQPDNTFVIVADAVNPLGSIIHDFSWLERLQRRAMVLIDDSHGIGILGPDGGGIIHSLPQHPPVRYLLSASLAKAYSIQGGIVAGSVADIAAIKKQPVFTAGTPIMPASAFAFLNSFTLHTTQRQLLQQQVAFFAKLMAGTANVYNPSLLPVFLLQHSAGIEERLLAQDIVISSFGYPDPDSPPINRVVISAVHTAENLQQLQAAIGSLTVKQ